MHVLYICAQMYVYTHMPKFLRFSSERIVLQHGQKNTAEDRVRAAEKYSLSEY